MSGRDRSGATYAGTTGGMVRSSCRISSTSCPLSAESMNSAGSACGAVRCHRDRSLRFSSPVKYATPLRPRVASAIPVRQVEKCVNSASGNSRRRLALVKMNRRRVSRSVPASTGEMMQRLAASCWRVAKRAPCLAARAAGRRRFVETHSLKMTGIKRTSRSSSGMRTDRGGSIDCSALAIRTISACLAAFNTSRRRLLPSLWNERPLRPAFIEARDD